MCSFTFYKSFRSNMTETVERCSNPADSYKKISSFFLVFLGNSFNRCLLRCVNETLKKKITFKLVNQ